MRLLHGIELQRTTSRQPSSGPGAGRFYRLIRWDNHLFTRWGVRGLPGRTQVEHFESSDAAAKRMSQRLAAHYRGDIYTEMYTTTNPRLQVTNGSSPEVAFLADWHTQARKLIRPFDVRPDGTTRAYWLILDGIVSEADRDPGAGALFDQLTAAPHAIDVHGDRLVVRGGSFATHSPGMYYGRIHHGADAEGFGWHATRVGDAAPEGTTTTTTEQRTAEVLLGLVAGRYLSMAPPHERAGYADAARRLATTRT